jgi:uncharacterized protein
MTTTGKPSLMFRALRRVKRIGVMVVFIYLGSILVLCLRESTYLYYPTPYPEQWYEPSWDTEYTDVFLPVSEDTSVHGIWFPGRSEGPVILFLHGNAGHLAGRYSLIRFLQSLNPQPGGILIIDYPGYGKSTGKPHQKTLMQSGKAASRYLRENLAVSADRLIVFGRSLGAAVALETAVNTPCGGLVMECAFLSVPHMAKDYYPFLPGLGVFSRQPYDNVSIISHLTVPLLLIHGDRDRIIPVHHSRKLFDQAPEPKQYLEVKGANHDNIYLVDTHAYKSAWENLLLSIMNAVSAGKSKFTGSDR